MEERFIEIKKTARYYINAEYNGQKNIWIVLHGYNQLARYFIRKFDVLNPKEHFVVAPEGLHRFYQAGHSGRVGASWMSKEDRLNDIKDYINYLNDLYEEIIRETGSAIRINLLGFSQGGATLGRWIDNGIVKWDNIILWATVFPEDVDFPVSKDKLSKGDIWLVHGDKDEFDVGNRLTIQKDAMHAAGLKFKEIVFEGNHDIERNTLLNLADQVTS